MERANQTTQTADFTSLRLPRVTHPLLISGGAAALLAGSGWLGLNALTSTGHRPEPFGSMSGFARQILVAPRTESKSPSIDGGEDLFALGNFALDAQWQLISEPISSQKPISAAVLRFHNGAWKAIPHHPNMTPTSMVFFQQGGKTNLCVATLGPSSAIVILENDGRTKTIGEFDGMVLCMMQFGNDLIAAGQFSKTNGETTRGIAAWNGTKWRELHNGFADSATPPSVLCLQVFEGRLFVGGTFDRAGDIPVQGIVEYGEKGWIPHDLGSALSGQRVGVRRLAILDGKLLAGRTHFTIGPNGIRSTFVDVKQMDSGGWSDIPLPNGLTSHTLSCMDSVGSAVYFSLFDAKTSTPRILVLDKSSQWSELNDWRVPRYLHTLSCVTPSAAHPERIYMCVQSFEPPGPKPLLSIVEQPIQTLKFR